MSGNSFVLEQKFLTISLCMMLLIITSLEGQGVSRQEYWSILANTGCHTLLETIFPAALAANPPEDLLLPEPL